MTSWCSMRRTRASLLACTSPAMNALSTSSPVGSDPTLGFQMQGAACLKKAMKAFSSAEGSHSHTMGNEAGSNCALLAAASVTSEMQYVDAKTPTGAFKVAIPRVNGKAPGATSATTSRFTSLYSLASGHGIGTQQMPFRPFLNLQMWSTICGRGAIISSSRFVTRSGPTESCWWLPSATPQIKR